MNDKCKTCMNSRSIFTSEFMNLRLKLFQKILLYMIKHQAIQVKDGDRE